MNSPKKKNTKVLLMLAAVFLIPVIAAKIVLSMNWYEGAVTNKGELLPESLSYQSLSMENPHPDKWQLVYSLLYVVNKYLLRWTIANNAFDF